MRNVVWEREPYEDSTTRHSRCKHAWVLKRMVPVDRSRYPGPVLRALRAAGKHR